MEAANLTSEAWNRINDLIADAPSGSIAGIRLSLIKGGCAGYEYSFDYIDAINKLDDVITDPNSNNKLYIERSALLYLLGTEIDYKVGLLESGFTFQNPNESSSCGCGKSVSFRSAPNTMQL